MGTSFLIAFITLLSVFNIAGQIPAAKCPELEIVGPQGIAYPGSEIVLRAKISGLDSRTLLNYDWKISGGRVLEGKATNQITLEATEQDAGGFITVSVLVNGLPENCSSNASEKYGVARRTHDTVLDQYGRIPWREEQARLDNLHVQISRNPEATGLIYMEIRAEDSVNAAKKHARKIANYFRSKYKKFDLGRLLLRIEPGSEWPSTRFYVLSKDEIRTCTNCIILSAKDL